MSEPLSMPEVRKVAELARLALSDEQLEAYRHQLGDVLGYMQGLRALDLTGVEPMTSPLETGNRLVDDVPGPTLPNASLMDIAPPGAADEPFIRVPKVIGGGEGA